MAQGFSSTGYFRVSVASEEPSDTSVEDTSTNYTDYHEAIEVAERLTRESDRGVYVCEAAVFTVGRSKKEAMILFWWNKQYAGYLEEVPRGRGHGYYFPKRGDFRFVDYEPDPDYEEAQEDDAAIEEEQIEDDDNYVETHCESCGKIMPLYEAHEYQTEEEVGRSSDSSRFGRSSTRRNSSKSSSHSYGSSSSNSSGRTYYRTKTLMLCAGCFGARSSADWTWTLMKCGLYGVGAIILAVFFFHAK